MDTFKYEVIDSILSKEMEQNCNRIVLALLEKTCMVVHLLYVFIKESHESC